eukprot:6196542-Pleurochrysis_carterae.AAC.2
MAQVTRPKVTLRNIIITEALSFLMSRGGLPLSCDGACSKQNKCVLEFRVRRVYIPALFKQKQRGLDANPQMIREWAQ